MKADLSTQIRDLATAYEDSLPAIDVRAVVEARRVSVEDASAEKTLRMEFNGGGDRSGVRPPMGWRGPLVAAGTAVAVLLIVGIAVLFFGANAADVTDPSVPTTTIPVTQPTVVESDEAFDMHNDSFCEWFTAQEMNEILATAQQRAGRDKVFEEFTPEGCDRTSWSTSGFFGSGTLRSGDAVSLMIELVGDFDDWVNQGGDPDTDVFVEHHMLSDGVLVSIRTSRFAWRHGVDGHLWVDGHEDEILYFGFGVDDNGYGAKGFEGLGLATFDEILRRMNWTDTGD